MSARRQGSWQQFRAAVEELHFRRATNWSGGRWRPRQFALPLYQALRFNLQRVGHAEFFAGAGGAEWRVTPKSRSDTARATVGSDRRGARSLALMQRLSQRPRPARLETLSFPAYPDQILVPATMRRRWRRSRNGWPPPAARRARCTLSSLPPIDDPSVRYPTQLPFGAELEDRPFLSRGLLAVCNARRRCVRVGRSLSFLSPAPATRALLLRGAPHFEFPAKWASISSCDSRRRQVLRYDATKRTLTVPASCRPPFLVETGPHLCSGSPPSYEGGHEAASSTTRDSQAIAALAAALLRQELR